MAKDLGYALKEAEKDGVPLDTASTALEIFKRAISKGLGNQDFSAVITSMSQE
jgi:3-hydroxyisobutyrate dehydrogenase-like beta-hydroxyacid dehydrogenase